MFRLSSLETIFQAMKYTFVPLVILENSPCPWTRLTSITSIQNIDTFIQQIKEMWSNKASNMIINDFLSSNKIKTNIKLLSQYSNTLSPIELSDEVSMIFVNK